MCSSLNDSEKWLRVTVYAAIAFTLFQVFEYCAALFSINDGVYGSLFFLTTGFHGFHILVGTILLIYAADRLRKGELSSRRHFGYESSIWYWHFVDLVWILLYICIYWWGNSIGIVNLKLCNS